VSEGKDRPRLCRLDVHRHRAHGADLRCQRQLRRRPRQRLRLWCL